MILVSVTLLYYSLTDLQSSKHLLREERPVKCLSITGSVPLSADVDFVIVHDGVRPFVTDEIIFACLTAADACGAAAAAVPVKDTIKVANADRFIVDTPVREQLWAVQTPQVFRKSLLEAAHQAAQEHQLTATDDAALVEQLGFPVKLVEGSYANLKITTPIDLRVAEVLIADDYPLVR